MRAPRSTRRWGSSGTRGPGHLPEVLGPGRGPAGGRPGGTDRQPLRRRRAALRPHRGDPRREGGTAMNAFPFVRRFLADYVRNPVNLFLLVVVPTVFVAVAAGRLAATATNTVGTTTSR